MLLDSHGFLASWPKSNSGGTASSFHLRLNFCSVISEWIITFNRSTKNGHCKHSCIAVAAYSIVWSSPTVFSFAACLMGTCGSLCLLYCFYWIICTSRDTTAHQFLETITCEEIIAFYRYSDKHYANGRQRVGQGECTAGHNNHQGSKYFTLYLILLFTGNYSKSSNRLEF